MFNMTYFLNRSQELGLIQQETGRGRFGYVTGRRRIGKTALLKKSCQTLGGFYHQAIEGTPEQQISHLAQEISEYLPLFKTITPRGWAEFFTLLSKEKLPSLVVFDEFPYWVDGDSTLPSILQKWIDHSLPRQKTLLMVSGSCQAMLHSQFLEAGAPLYGRAHLHLALKPMEYSWFCKSQSYKKKSPQTFERFSLVGGVPHYWQIMPKGSLLQQAEILYFTSPAMLSEEPSHMLRDEKITGNIAKAVLDLIGRGVTKPSELASRLNIPQGNLSRSLALLCELGFIHREHPFGESARTTKKVLYSVLDPVLSFYYRTVLFTRQKWPHMHKKEKKKLIHEHASRYWEVFCRAHFVGSSRYWEKDIEIDLVAPVKGKKEGKYLVAECKWKNLSEREEKTLYEQLQFRFQKSALSKKLKGKIEYKIFSQKDLGLF